MARQYTYSIFGYDHGKPYYTIAPEDLQVDANGLVQYTKLLLKRGKIKEGDIGSPDEIEVKVAIRYLKLCEPTKTGRLHSYHLKHLIEEWRLYFDDGINYVSNGATIEAAKRLRLVVLASVDGPNCLIGIARRSTIKLHRMCRLEKDKKEMKDKINRPIFQPTI